MTLHELADKYGSDKLFCHSYIDKFYAGAFAGQHPHLLLEIGIGYADLMRPFVPHYEFGSSLYMWRDYFHECQIVGIDIREDVIFEAERISTYLCHQERPSSLIQLIDIIGRPDIIIDDGSHITEDQIISAITLLPYLKLNGFYVIEDVQEPLKIYQELEAMNYKDVHMFRWDKRLDDCLVVIRK